MKTWRSEMRRYSKYIIVAGALAALAAPSAAMASNSGNAQACQQGGWQTLIRQDGTGFANQSDCVSYGANGGTLYRGSENFSEDALGSQPKTFSGGTIDSPYGVSPADATWFPAGGVLNQAGGYFDGLGYHSQFLFTGLQQNTAHLTFTNPAKSVQLLAESDKTGIDTQLTLTGYDASGNPVPGATATATQTAGSNQGHTLKITSATANIKSFTITTADQGNNAGLGFTNILWS
jgi:hypothetical protein